MDVLTGRVAETARDGLLDKLQRHHEGLHLEIGYIISKKIGRTDNGGGNVRETEYRDKFHG